MTTHEVLVAAKGYLLNHGWRQGDYGVHGGPRCALGACRSASGEHTDGDFMGRFSWNVALCNAMGTGSVSDWNDNHALDEVIAAFDRAILATAPPLDDTPIFQALEGLPAEDYIECLSVLALIPAGALA